MKSLLIRLGIMMLTMFLSLSFIFALPSDIIKNNPIIIYFIVFSIILLIAFLPKLIFKSQKVGFKDYISLEKIPEEFEKIYVDLYNNHIYNLESMRKQVRWRTIIQYIALVLFFIGYVFGKSDYVLISKELDNIITLVGLVGFVVTMIFLFLNNKHKRKYTETYKKEIVSNFVKLINNQLEYKPFDIELFRSQEDYKKAAFDNKAFNRFYPDDYIEGFVDDETFIKMCDLHIQHHTGSGKNGHTEEIFHGIFSHTKSGKDIGTYIKISKNKMKIFNKHDRVEMDSEEFEKYFDIYSENKIVTMQLLTSDIMESLIEFHNKYGIDYEIALRNNTIYMRFFTGAMFEPKIFGNSMDKQLLFIYFCILKFVVDITKKVNKTLQDVEI